jgi:TonB family protein
MRSVVSTSIFSTVVAERGWKTYVSSGIVHALVIGAAFVITFPSVVILHSPEPGHVTLIAPVIPQFHPTIQAPPIQHLVKLPPPVVVKPVSPDPVIPPPEPKPVVKNLPPAIVPVPPPAAPPAPTIVAEVKPDVPTQPKPVKAEELPPAKLAALPKPVVVGGFGDPHGVQNSQKPAPVLMTRIGSFDSPVGPGQSGGQPRTNGFRPSGFGNAGVTDGPPGPNTKAVHTGNFGDPSNGPANGKGHDRGPVQSSGFGEMSILTPPGARKDVPVAVAPTTPLEILFKPRPSYSAEARGLRLEGEVSLEVVFQANGAVKVVRVIKGLGHGLDEAAAQAAVQVRFKPAMRSGAPIDTSATISITFELT